MGNVKQNNKPGIIIYFIAIVLLGVGLFFAEKGFVEQYFQPSQTVRTFAVLMYITFAFFWDGTGFLSSSEKKSFSSKKNNIPTNNSTDNSR